MPISTRTYQFIASLETTALLKDLGSHFKTHPLNVSDVRDNRFQNVDLVQQGGGIWRIALVGYTYILEKVGIRFFSWPGPAPGPSTRFIYFTFI
jgi:hypothetical protein